MWQQRIWKQLKSDLGQVATDLNQENIDPVKPNT